MSVDNDTRVTTKRGGYAARSDRTTRGTDDDNDDARPMFVLCVLMGEMPVVQ